MKVAMILDNEKLTPWIPDTIMDEDMPTGHLVVIQSESERDVLVEWGTVGSNFERTWYVNKENIEILGDL